MISGISPVCRKFHKRIVQLNDILSSAGIKLVGREKIYRILVQYSGKACLQTRLKLRLEGIIRKKNCFLTNMTCSILDGILGGAGGFTTAGGGFTIDMTRSVAVCTPGFTKIHPPFNSLQYEIIMPSSNGAYEPAVV